MKFDKLAQQETAVSAFSASEDEEQNVTAAIQRAIDIVHARGGGRVYMPPGRYQVGSLELKSGVDLHLEAGAVFVGSREKSDYTQSTAIPQEFVI